MRDYKKSRHKVLFVLFILNLVAIFSVYGALQKIYDWTIQDAEARSQNIALAVDLQLSTVFSKIDLSLLTVASELTYYHKEGDWLHNEHINDMIQHQKALLSELEGWSITDAEGNIIFHQNDIGRANFSVSDREYFLHIKSDKNSGLQISRPIISRASGNLVVVLTRGYYSEKGAFLGIVVVPLPVSYLNKLLSGFSSSPQGIVSLLYSDMETIAESSLSESPSVAPFDYSKNCKELAVMIETGAKQATFHSVCTQSQCERILSYRKNSIAPLLIVAGVSKDYFLKGFNQTVLVSIILLGLFLIFMNVGVFLLYRQWQRQNRDALMLQESNTRLAASLNDLKERERALFAAEEAGRLGTYTLNIQKGLWICSPQLDAIFGITPSFDHSVENWEKLIHTDDRTRMAEYFSGAVLEKRGIFDNEYRVVRPADGKIIWVHGFGKLELNEKDEPIKMSGTIQDISARKLFEERLILANEVFQNAIVGFVIIDLDGTILEINPAYTLITGYSSEEIIGKNAHLLKSDLENEEFYEKVSKKLFEQGFWEGDLVNRRKDGTIYIQHSRVSSILDSKGNIARVVTVIQDVTELAETQRKLENLAYYDALTELPNRVLLSDRMKQIMAKCRREPDQLLGICCLDLDGFKEINDRWGHDVGDQLLIEVSRRLQSCTRGNDTVARLGGDEFIVLLSDLDDDINAKETVLRLQKTVGDSYWVDGVNHRITVSVGVTLYPKNTTDEPDVLLRQADQAMYEAKRRGKNRIYFFDVESEQRLQEYQSQLENLREALRLNQFRLFYQPKVDLKSGRVTGVEALLRWHHPEKGMLQPYAFLPVLETTELTLPVGEWIIHEALQQRQRWLNVGIDVEVSVNIFGLHLQREDFVERLDSILKAYPEKVATSLEFEIVETTALENLEEITKRINGCKKLGVKFSLDDFGTGYSSLTYMQQLPTDIIKIDRSFVSGMLQNEDDHLLVESIVGMAHILRRKVVAEGVETIEQGVALKRCGCDYLQGYGIAMPMPPGDLADWVPKWHCPEAWMEP